jgi:hypothetical protein
LEEEKNNQVRFTAAHILQFMMKEPSCLKALQTSPKPIGNIMNFISQLRASDGLEEEILTSLNILKPICAQEALIPTLRAQNLVESILKLLASDKFPQHVHLDALNVYNKYTLIQFLVLRKCNEN